MGIIAWIYEPYRESHDTDFRAKSAGNDRIMVSLPRNTREKAEKNCVQ